MKASPSISIQILLAVLVTVVSMLGLSSVIELNVLRQRETATVQQRGALIADRVANSLAYPLWNLNREETERVVLDEINSADVFKVLVFDEGGALYVGKVRDGQGSIRNVAAADAGAVTSGSAAVYSYSRPISFREHAIGHVTLEVSDASVLAELRKLRWGIAIKLLLLVSLLSVVLFVALRVLVIRPLSTLKSWVEAVASTSLVRPPRFKRSGEINSLAEEFGRMSATLREKNLELGSERVTMRELYNNAPCGYHSLDAKGIYVQVNDTELSWLGRTREEVVGKISFSEVLTEAGRDRFAEQYGEFLTGGSVRDIEYEIVSRDGATRAVLLSSTAARDEAGRFLKSRTTLYDVTERKQAERRANQLAY
jgi:PAS domain S-box-containing protein